MGSESSRRLLAGTSLLVGLVMIAAACSNGTSSGTGGGATSSLSADTMSPSAWLYVGDVSDADYNAAHYQAMQQMAQKFSLETNYQDSVSVADVERLATQDVANGAKTVVLTSSSWFTNVTDLASKNPSVDFIGFIGSPEPPPDQAKNLWLMGLNFYDAEYVLGVLAGLQTKTNKIAYLAGLKIPGLIAGANAYAAGACSVNPSVEVSNLVVGSFDDASMARDAASSLIRRGVDVLQVHLNGGIPGVVEAIGSSGQSVYWSGLNTDKHSLDQAHYLGSAIFDFASGYEKAFESIKAGTTTGFFDLANQFSLSQLYNVDQSVESEVQDASDGVLSGSVDVPINTTNFKPTCG